MPRLSYTVDNLQVVMNGIVLDPSDFTATNGTSVVLASGAALNDLVNIYAFKSFTTADMVSKTAGGTFSGAVGFSGGITGDVAFDTNTLKVDSSNNRVGIGTTSPSKVLDVRDNDATGTTTSSNRVALFATNGTGKDAHITFSNLVDSPASIGNKGALYFDYNNTERMRIDSSGNVGIGTTSPGGSLEVYKAGTSEVLIGTDNGGTAQLSLYENDDGTKEGLLKYDGTNNRIHLATSGDANALVMPRDTGYVGLGTTDFTTQNGSVSRLLKLSGANNTVIAAEQTGSGKNFILEARNDGRSGGDRYAQMSFAEDGSDNGAIIFYTASSGSDVSERMRIDSDGAVRISTSSEPDGSADGVQIRPFGGNTKFSRDATPTRDQILFYNPNGLVGRIQTNGSATSYVTSSDHRLKENVADMTGAIDRVKALAPKRFNFIADDSVTLDGFLAHEAQAVVPEAVNGTHNEVDEDGNAVMQGIDQSKLVPLLTGALREAITKIETLETKVAALEAAE